MSETEQRSHDQEELKVLRARCESMRKALEMLRDDVEWGLESGTKPLPPYAQSLLHSCRHRISRALEDARKGGY